MPSDHDKRAERWRRNPPKSGMPIEEMLKRVDDGIKRRRQTGELKPEGLRAIKTVRDGPGLDKKQRTRVIRAAELAIYALANGDRDDYIGAIRVINATRRQAGMSTQFMQAVCEGVADQAALCADEPRAILDQLARRWLADELTTAAKVISLPPSKQGAH